ncbi:MAG: hypothetical protein EOM36_10925, partial [Bacteroidia bacterium]|nr:hypothetical protein [Bacteroidia bacterium]
QTKLTERDFINQEEADCFSAMKKIMFEGGVIDLVSLKQAGVSVKLLASLEPTISSSWKHREKLIIEATKKRDILIVAEKVIQSSDLPASELLSLMADEVAKADRRSDYEVRYVYDVANQEIEKILARDSRGIIGYPTGYSKLDFLTLGFQPRKLYFVGARPSQGKTALLVNFALKCNERFGFLSAESGQEEVIGRMFAISGKLDARKLQLGTRGSTEFTQMSNFIEHETGLKSVIYDKANMAIDDLILRARDMVDNFGCRILFIDYIQIIEASDDLKRKDKREQIMSVSLRLKQLARDLNVPVVVAAQLTRDADKERPRLSSFAETSQIEKDADVAILIWNTTVKAEEIEYDKTYLLVEKNRDGMTGDVEVEFDKPTMRFL